MLAGLQKEGAEEAELRGQLEAVQSEEATLPAQIEALQARLQAELDRVTQREGGAHAHIIAQLCSVQNVMNATLDEIHRVIQQSGVQAWR